MTADDTNSKTLTDAVLQEAGVSGEECYSWAALWRFLSEDSF